MLLVSTVQEVQKWSSAVKMGILTNGFLIKSKIYLKEICLINIMEQSYENIPSLCINYAYPIFLPLFLPVFWLFK